MYRASYTSLLAQVTCACFISKIPRKPALQTPMSSSSQHALSKLLRQERSGPQRSDTPLHCMYEKSKVRSGCVSRLHLPHSCAHQQSCVHACLHKFMFAYSNSCIWMGEAHFKVRQQHKGLAPAPAVLVPEVEKALLVRARQDLRHMQDWFACLHSSKEHPCQCCTCEHPTPELKMLAPAICTWARWLYRHYSFALRCRRRKTCESYRMLSRRCKT